MTSRPFLLALLAISFPLLAQNESRVHSDFRREFEEFKQCGHFDFGSIAGCAETLATGQPIHLAFGSIAPQNGTAFGLALVEHTDFKNRLRVKYNLDAVASGNGSWRTGAFITGFRQPGGLPVVNHPGSAPIAKTPPLFNIAPIFSLYSETTSLNRVYFYGLGQNTTPATATIYGFQETIVGTKAVLPYSGPLGLGFLLEFNGRFPSVRPGNSTTIATTQSLFTETTVPGLTHQQAFFQAGEGLRLQPRLPKDLLRLNYLLQYQQFISSNTANNNFRRWTIDLGHEIPLYRNVHLTAANPHNGPDACASDNSSTAPRPCPHISRTQNLEGSISARLLISESFAKAGSAVPFYFMPTLGGSNINGESLLPSYPDYRFRGPDLILLRGTIEHSIGKLPIGAIFSYDEGKVATRRDGIAFDHLRHSFTAGLTVHAGGLPVISLLFSWGGNEGHHNAATISNALLGGSARPSLF